MEVKLHKGPMHGKTYTVRDGQQDIVMQSVKKSDLTFAQWKDPDLYPPMFSAVTSRYRMKTMYHPDYGNFPCVDPDGRVFFEYVK